MRYFKTEKLGFSIGRERWRSPLFNFNYFKLRLRRTSYLVPQAMAYQFRFVILGFCLELEVLRKVKK